MGSRGRTNSRRLFDLLVAGMPSDRDVEGAVRRTVILAEGFQIPDFKLDAGFPSLREAYAAMRAHQVIHDLARSLRDHSEVPSTFDGEAPELAFSTNEARLTIGSWYEVQVGPEGETAPAKLFKELSPNLNDQQRAFFSCRTGGKLLLASPFQQQSCRPIDGTPQRSLNVLIPPRSKRSRRRSRRLCGCLMRVKIQRARSCSRIWPGRPTSTALSALLIAIFQRNMPNG